MVDKDLEGKTWKCTGFYGASEEFMREASWNLLRSLNVSLHIPWVVIADFNEIAFSTKNLRGIPRRDRQMSRFREALDDCSLTDMGYNG